MAKSGISLDWGGLDRRLMEAARGLAAHQAILADIGEALVSSTVRSYLAWLKDTGRVDGRIENNMLLWETVI